MSIVNLRDLEWIRIEDWSMLHPTCGDTRNYIGKRDIFNCIDYISKDIARKLGTSYEHVKQVILRENEPCIRYVKRRFFLVCYSKTHEVVENFKHMFLIPKVDGYTLERAIAIYNSLDTKEKAEFNKRIQDNELM